MGFWTPNIDRRGRTIRAVIAVALFVAAFFAHREGLEWIAVLLAVSGLVCLIEVVRGWCVLRACKIRTRF